jgi:SulP family sulfate permease
MVMTTVGALLASSKLLINGPTNAICIALFSAIASLPLSSVDDRVSAAVLMALLVGTFQVSITLLRLGDLSRFISHAVIIGFTIGAAIILVLDQLKNLLGLAARGDSGSHFLKRLWMTIAEGGPVEIPTAMLGLGTIGFVVLVGWLNRRLRRRIPELLLAVMVAASVVALFDLDHEQRNSQGEVIRSAVAVVGAIPRALPTFKIPSVSLDGVRELAGSALALALLGLLEALAMAKAIAGRTGEKFDVNQQCLSEGVANLAGSLFQCFPGSGSLTRSAINHQAGAATQWSGVISAAAVAATVLLFAPWARYIPRAALAGILIVSAYRMVDHHRLAYHMRATRLDAVIIVATALAAILVSIEFCILIGTLLSFLIYLPRAARVTATELVVTPEQVRERKPSDPELTKLLIYNLEGELFFGSGAQLEQLLADIEARVLGGGARVVVLRTKYARNLDGVCLHVLEEFLSRMESQRVTVLLCGVRADMIAVFENVGLAKRMGAGRIFPEAEAVWSSTREAVSRAEQILAELSRASRL